MKIEELDGLEESRLLAAMISNKIFLAKIADKWTKEGLFSSKWANLVGGWCVSYFRKHGNAPKSNINPMYTTWMERYGDNAQGELLERFIQQAERKLSKEKLSSSFLLESAEEVFNKNKINRHMEQVQGLISSGRVKEADSLMSSYVPVKLDESSWVHVFSDTKAMELAMTESAEPIVEYSGALGEFFKGQLTRDAFVSFMSPEKRGKTFWLIDVAFTAYKQNRKVAFFEVGDMSQGQIMRRFAQGVSGRPLKVPKKESSIIVKIPTMIHHTTGSSEFEVEYKSKEFFEDLTTDIVSVSMENAKRKYGDNFMLSCHPTNTISAAGIESKILELIRTGWVPDVVVVDYADLLSPIRGNMEPRDAINETWKALRSISQKYHVLLVTATQSDAQSYETSVLGMRNFSEDKRKLAHVTGIVGVNQTPMEKQQQVQRLNWIVLRESDFTESECVFVGNCRAVSRMSCCSSF